jgi:hypothetical protein
MPAADFSLNQREEFIMHDIDRVRLETEFESEGFETSPFQSESLAFGEAEATLYGEAGGVFSETQEMELASEMLEIMSEAELDHFLGNLIRSAGSAVGSLIRSPAGQAIGGILKGAAKKALPALGSAIGGQFGGASGAQLGRQAASAAGRLFGLELEGLSGEDQEFELARRYVRFAGEAVKNLALNPAAADPRAAAQAAIVQAAQALAPGLLQPAASHAPPAPGPAPMPAGNSGRWMRRGNKIILYGM